MSHTEDYYVRDTCKGAGLCDDPHCTDHGRLNPRSPYYAPPKKAGAK